VAKLRERISVGKRRKPKYYLEIFELRMLDVIEVKEKYHIEISKRFEALENLDKNLDILRLLQKSIRESMKISAKENQGYSWLNCNKQWFNDKCSKLTDQRKQDNLQWLQNQSQIDGDNLQN
jgi:hypothetical protein